jgi:PAS domain S-box-containing protein
VSSAAAVAVTASNPVLQGVPFALNFVAVSASAWFGGFRAGILATLVSAFLVDYWILPPRHTFVLGKASAAQIFVVSAVALFICLIARQREQKEQSLAKSEQLFRGLVEGISEGFESFDSDWNYTYINTHGASLSGHTPEQLVGKNVWQVFPEAKGTAFERVLKSAALQRTFGRVTEYYAPLEKWIEVTAYPIQGGVAAIFQDVSDKIKAEERLRTADRLAIAGRLAATVSHEINNPLEAIGNLLFLAEHDPSAKKVKEYIRDAAAQLLRASQISKQMLSFHRAANEANEVALSSAVRDAMRMFEGRYEGRGIRMRQELDDSVRILIARGELVQVVLNLLSNALDAAPAGSEVLVEVTHDSGSAFLKVTDQGNGVAPEHQTKVFDAFFTTKKDYGTGLGLWVCKNIAERYKGKISVHNRPEKRGAVFTVEFPLAVHPLTQDT